MQTVSRCPHLMGQLRYFGFIYVQKEEVRLPAILQDCSSFSKSRPSGITFSSQRTLATGRRSLGATDTNWFPCRFGAEKTEQTSRYFVSVTQTESGSEFPSDPHRETAVGGEVEGGNLSISTEKLRGSGRASADKDSTDGRRTRK